MIDEETKKEINDVKRRINNNLRIMEIFKRMDILRKILWDEKATDKEFNEAKEEFDKLTKEVNELNR